MHNFIKNNKVVHVPPNAGSGTTYSLSAGTTQVKSGSIDRAGFEELTWLAIFGDNADTGTFKMTLQHADTDSDAAFTDAKDEDGNVIEESFTAGASDTDDKMLSLSAYGTKLKRYVRVVITRGTANTGLAALLCIVSQPQNKPVTQSTGAGQFIVAPSVDHVVN